MIDSRKRFSDRVADYVKYRPGYPLAVLAHLRDELGLRPEHVVADIGSGTGIFSRLLLDNGNMVFGIEPNREMREAAEHSLEAYTGFKSMSATAEATTLPDATVDFVTCAQAFHWFEPMRARRELSRVLKRGGQAILVWNIRLETGAAFYEEYEALLRNHCPDYIETRHGGGGLANPEALARFFGARQPRFFSCANKQVFDLAGLEGRLLSSSYAPRPGHPAHEPMMRDLSELFGRHERNGRVSFEYETKAFSGALE